jgi:hypothetical protein
LVLKDQVSRDEAAPRLQKTSKQRRCDRERRVRDDVVWPPRQPKVASIGRDDGDCFAEAPPKVEDPLGVHLDGDHAHSRRDQRRCDRARARTDIDDAGAGRDVRVSDEPLGPSTVELVPSPCPSWRGHGDGP